jgi:hypothetical protein
MALTNFKQQTNNQIDETGHLFCSVPGCGKRWSVHMEGYRPMCSEHQWGGKTLKPKKNLADALKAKNIVQWYDDKDEIY